MSTTIKEEKETASLLDSTQVVIKEALDKLGYSEEVFELLKEPLRMLTVRIPRRRFSLDTVPSTTMLSVRRKAESVFILKSMRKKSRRFQCG